jgi:hypothetical protein
VSPEQLEGIYRRILMGAAASFADASPRPPAVVEVSAVPTFCEGRHPAGLVTQPAVQNLTGAGGYLARMAHFEHAAVSAFVQLAAELEEHAAPERFVDTARRAASEEVVHAQTVAALARARGARPPAPRLKAVALRSLEAIALDNAAEGCVREAFGALVGLYQSAHASAPDVREAMKQVARDEVEHAAFSFELKGWLDRKLSPEARGRVAEARDEALAALLHRVFAFEDVPWREELGLPDADTLFELARAFRAELA